MANIVLLDRVAHRDLRIDPTSSSKLGDGQNFARVVLPEFGPLALHYPLLFSKDEETGAFFVGAMLGIDPAENLFLRKGGRQEAYRPLTLQRGPFFGSANGLAIDLSSPRVGPDRGESLFDERGSETDYLKSIAAAIGALRTGQDVTDFFVRKAVQLNLISPIDIHLSFDDGTERDLEGLYSVNQDALRTLSDADVIDLFRQGFLHALHLMVTSVGHIATLARMKNDRLSDHSWAD